MASIVRMLTILERFSSNLLLKQMQFSRSLHQTNINGTRNLVKCKSLWQIRCCSSSSSANSFTYRTHTCGELNLGHEGKKVTICGWLQYQRMGLFATLKDTYGIMQLLIPPENIEAINLLRVSAFESVLKVSGVVTKRPDGQENPKMATGAIEIVVEDITMLNKCKPKLPFLVRDYMKVKEPLRLQYRYLDLRSNKLQRVLRLRSQFLMKVREKLCNDLEFVEVETPTLFRRTPGGAQEFIVPTRNIGKCYSLTQSPQQFKQLLMVGGIDRYFQIARCYRDEGAKSDRQPEFTQIDLEMSFTDADSVMKLVEEILSHAWSEGEKNIKLPFTRLTYQQAMARYGSDKPDTRLGMELFDLADVLRNSNALAILSALGKAKNGVVRAMTISKGHECFSRSVREKLGEQAESEFGLPGLIFIKVNENMEWTGECSKHISKDSQNVINARMGLEAGHFIVMSAGEDSIVTPSMGKIRLEIASFLEKKGVNIKTNDDLNFLWITDFPLFFQTKEGLYDTAHHPFTSPRLEDVHLLKTNPGKVRGQHYDLVLNGVEIGGGSIRIHDEKIQRYILQHILQESPSEMDYFLTALDSGCPPHGGIALGVDRLLTILCEAFSIRDVIAFPKSSLGFDLMSNAPAVISEQDSQLYGLKFKNEHQGIICNNKQEVINQ
uniref:Aminoacyl-transfer RNA synthetases class-II family profile domain-containing protein n=1 Tax=Strigamia maritima TaxID=126957 RepID=T1J196_STRMM